MPKDFRVLFLFPLIVPLIIRDNVRYFWHRLFGHGFTTLHVTSDREHTIYCKCGYAEVFRDYAYRWSPEDNA